ncbi:hypothetical protein V2W45_42761 [Cenococcum geophilum]
MTANLQFATVSNPFNYAVSIIHIASFLGAIPSSLSLYANAPLMPPPPEGFLRLQDSKASGAGHTFLHGCAFAFVASSVFVDSGIFSRLMIDVRLDHGDKCTDLATCLNVYPTRVLTGKLNEAVSNCTTLA